MALPAGLGGGTGRPGFVLVAIDYRLGSGEPFGLDQATEPDRVAVVSDAIADVTAAVRWLRTSASQWRVDPDRLVIGGTSAGAMTAMGAALTNPDDDRPCAVVSISGDLDSEWVGPTPVPALFVHGDADMLVPYRSSVDAVQTLTAAGGQAQLVTISGAGHEVTGIPLATSSTPSPGGYTKSRRWDASDAAGRGGSMICRPVDRPCRPMLPWWEPDLRGSDLGRIPVTTASVDRPWSADQRQHPP